MACVRNCFRSTEADRRADTRVSSNAGSTSREGFGLSQYSYGELAEATDKFSNKKLLGEGSFGLVYEGTLGGKKVAIKKLKIRPDERSQSKEESEKEIKVVSKVSHKNLVKLFGYCIEGDDILLILEHVPGKSLKHHLHGEKTLKWTKRMKIAIGTAKGLEYLHENCTPKIIHRDIKADNILIDDKYEPKVADFGLAFLFPETGSLTHITKSNKGTEVYVDPEHYPQNVSEKLDVYSYGVVLLELITGRKVKDEGIDIVTWAKSRIECALRNGNYGDLVDSKLLQTNYDEKEMEIMIYCAAACIYKPSISRPSMNQIVRALEGYMHLEGTWNEKNDSIFLKNNPTPNVSHRVEPNGSDNEPYRSQKQKPFVSSEANYNGIEPREFTLREHTMATYDSSDTTNGTERFQDYQQGRTNFQEDYQLRRFTYQELTTATGGFSEDNRLDEGPLGQVFKGDLNGKMVTVKKFNNSRKQKEEYTKMKAINLIGYCEEGVNRLLVYEFVPQDKSLRYYLFGDERSHLDWTTGVRISQAAATLIYIWIFQIIAVGGIDHRIGWTTFFLMMIFQRLQSMDVKCFIQISLLVTPLVVCLLNASNRKLTEKTNAYSCRVMHMDMMTGRNLVDDISFDAQTNIWLMISALMLKLI
ncbi:leucine-rich repeat receptor protein kinase HPCA1 isoform X2 [Hevea brasiliensis]|uniref:leucine-rich repeat receptor protein kinase HPCA1 isoform X2 n=1 Tax=Hevea brasiliensis TaxID=3981 RepID=UPI0025EA6DA4|nr:leucine-rich repeat receptor protein kinase HPCA1 isoform X2 [Hevea brasiliensis]